MSEERSASLDLMNKYYLQDETGKEEEKEKDKRDEKKEEEKKEAEHKET